MTGKYVRMNSTQIFHRRMDSWNLQRNRTVFCTHFLCGLVVQNEHSYTGAGIIRRLLYTLPLIKS